MARPSFFSCPPPPTCECYAWLEAILLDCLVFFVVGWDVPACAFDGRDLRFVFWGRGLQPFHVLHFLSSVVANQTKRGAALSDSCELILLLFCFRWSRRELVLYEIPAYLSFYYIFLFHVLLFLYGRGIWPGSNFAWRSCTNV